MHSTVSLMQRALGDDWQALPAAIQRHYQLSDPQQNTILSSRRMMPNGRKA